MIERVIKTFPDWTMPTHEIAEQFARSSIGKVYIIEQESWFGKTYKDYRVVDAYVKPATEYIVGHVVAIFEEIE